MKKPPLNKRIHVTSSNVPILKMLALKQMKRGKSDLKNFIEATLDEIAEKHRNKTAPYNVDGKVLTNKK